MGIKGIESVPLSYFTGGMERVDGGDKNVAAQNGAGKADAQILPANAKAAKNKSLAQMLDVLMLRAAKNSVTAVLDKGTAKSQFKKLVKDGAMSGESLKALANAADRADKAYRELNKLSGKHLAGAFNENGFDPTSGAGKVIAEAVEAQAELSDLLAQVDKQLGAMERHAERTGKKNKVDATVHARVQTCRLICDSRATEINALAHQMHEFALRLTAQGQNPDPNLRKILDASVRDLLPRQALAMHGTVDTLTALNEGVMEKMRPLAARIDAFRANPNAKLSGEEILSLKDDIAKMRAAAEDVARNGVEFNGSRIIVPRDFTQGLMNALDDVSKKLDTARQEVAAKVCARLVDNIGALIGGTVELTARDEGKGYDRYVEFVQKRDKFLDKLSDFAKHVASGKSTASSRAKKMRGIGALADEVQKAAKVSGLEGKGKYRVPRDAQKTVGRCHYMNIFMAQLKEMDRALGMDDSAFFGSAEAMSLFRGELSPSSVVEARMRGLKDSDVDPATEDRNVESARFLGEGQGGSVHLLKYADGSERVFKGEVEARSGLSTILIGDGDAYDAAQTTVNLNMAARETAEALGFGSLVVKYTAGVHDGVFGCYMDHAKGITGSNFSKGYGTPDDSLSRNDIADLPREQNLQVKGDLMREMNRLQWLDLVTGQTDRHGNNYFVHVEPGTLKVTVTGIDNDAGFSKDRVGANTFRLDTVKSYKVERTLDEISKVANPANPKAEYRRMLDDPAIEKRQENGKTLYTVDFSKIKNPAMLVAMRFATGFNSGTIPNKIDRQMYEKLVALKSGPAREAYFEKLSARLDAESLEAARTRLDDVIAHAERLAGEGKVVDSDGWAAQEETPRETGGAKLVNCDGRTVELPSQHSHVANGMATPSYFARDGMDDMFY